MKQEVVIQLCLDEHRGRFRDLGKITHHSLIVESIRAYANSGFDAVPMQVPALARMLHEPMPIAEIDFFDNGIHQAATVRWNSDTLDAFDTAGDEEIPLLRGRATHDFDECYKRWSQAAARIHMDLKRLAQRYGLPALEQYARSAQVAARGIESPIVVDELAAHLALRAKAGKVAGVLLLNHAVVKE